METVLITGGTRGIGLSIAERLAQEGWRIAVTFNSDIKAADECEARWTKHGYDFRLFQCDISNPDSARTVPSQVAGAFGGIDALVNNAGITDDGLFLLMQPERYQRLLNTNLIGTIRLTSAALPFLMQSQRRAIVIVSSFAGVIGKVGQAAYGMTKGGLIGFTHLLSRKYGAHGLRVNAVAPSFIKTAMVDGLDPRMYEHTLRSTATHRMGEPEEVAAAVSFLLHPGYVQGTTLKIDGGYKR